MFNKKGIVKNRMIKAGNPMILVMVMADDSVVTDYNAILECISPEVFTARTTLDIDGRLVRAEGIVSGGRIMQPMPLAGKFLKEMYTKEEGHTYLFAFGGVSYYAVKYINIRTPRRNAGRKKKGAKAHADA